MLFICIRSKFKGKSQPEHKSTTCHFSSGFLTWFYKDTSTSWAWLCIPLHMEAPVAFKSWEMNLSVKPFMNNFTISWILCVCSPQCSTLVLFCHGTPVDKNLSCSCLQILRVWCSGLNRLSVQVCKWLFALFCRWANMCGEDRLGVNTWSHMSFAVGYGFFILVYCCVRSMKTSETCSSSVLCRSYFILSSCL